jgi:hypothetical protein
MKKIASSSLAPGSLPVSPLPVIRLGCVYNDRHGHGDDAGTGASTVAPRGQF